MKSFFAKKGINLHIFQKPFWCIFFGPANMIVANWLETDQVVFSLTLHTDRYFVVNTFLSLIPQNGYFHENLTSIYSTIVILSLYYSKLYVRKWISY